MKRGYAKEGGSFSQIPATLRVSKNTHEDKELLMYSEMLRESLPDAKFILNGTVLLNFFRKGCNCTPWG